MTDNKVFFEVEAEIFWSLSQANLNFVPTFPGGTEENPDKLKIGNILADIRSIQISNTSVDLRHYCYTKVCSVHVTEFLTSSTYSYYRPNQSQLWTF